MKSKFLAVFVCVLALVLAGCTYETDWPKPGQTAMITSEPTLAVSFMLPEPLRIASVSAMQGGLQTSVPLPALGECSFDQARQSPIGDIHYLGPSYIVPSLSTDMLRIHNEGSMLTVSWPQNTYLHLKRLTPEIMATPVKIFEITRESFESLMHVSPSLQGIVMSLGILSTADTFFVTSYDCIPLDGIKE